jgi:hypothetical protein
MSTKILTQKVRKIADSRIISTQTLHQCLIGIVYAQRVQIVMLAEKRGILSKQPSYEPPGRLESSIHMNLQLSTPPEGKLSDMEAKLSLGCHLRVQPRAKLAPATK